MAASPDGRKREKRERQEEDKTQKEGQSGGTRQHDNMYRRKQRRRNRKGKRETGVKNSSVEEEWSVSDGVWLGMEVGGASEQDEGMKVCNITNDNSRTKLLKTVFIVQNKLVRLNQTSFKCFSIKNI